MRTLITILFICSTFLAQASKTEYGLASVYSDEYENSATASGENYDPSKHTAAHKSLPFGSIIKVTNMDSGKSVMVKVNDRGPFIRGYVIELSGAAADILKIKKKGAKVKLEVEKEGVYPEDSELKEDTYVEEENPFDTSEDKPTSYNVVSDPFTPKEVAPKAEPKADSNEASKKSDKKEEKALTTLKSKGFKVYDLYKASTFIPKASGYGVQVGTYNNLHNVLKETAKLQESWFSKIMLTREIKGDKLIYKVIIGPFDQRSSAASYKKNAAKKGVNGFVVAVQPSKLKEVYQIKAVRPAKEGFAIQIMNLTDADNVILEINKLKEMWFKNILINVVKGDKDGKPHYKILLGPFPERKTADSYKDALTKKKISGFVVDLSTIK